MRTRWIYTGCDTDDERQITHHWEREVQPGLEAQLETPDATIADLIISVVHEDDESETPWEMQAVLSFPAATFAGDARAVTPEKALDESIRQLTEQLEQRREESNGAVVRFRGLQAIIPFLEQARRQERMRVFAAFLRPLLRSLRRHAARELAIREIEGDLLGGQWEVDDVLDETLLQAWTHFDRRPQSVPLDGWLVGLLGQVLEATREESHESLNREEGDSQRRPVDAELSEDQWVERPQLMDELELSDLLPGRETMQAWEQIDPDHRDVGLNLLLGRLSRAQREALVLSAVHGLEAEEIAAVQQVSPGQAQAAIDAGRHQLERLIEQDEFWPELQQSIEERRRDPRRIRR